MGRIVVRLRAITNKESVMPLLEELTLDIFQSLEIKAAVGDAYSALIRRLTSENSTPDNKATPLSQPPHPT